jgi:hypothetical protein
MVQTNNSYIADKVALRAGHLPAGNVRVLDCFGGEGKIWTAVKKLTGRKITALPIDIKEYDDAPFHLPGDNRAYLETLDLTKFNVIDLDAYGVPFDQLEQVFNSKYTGVIFVTFIQSIMRILPFGLLQAVGFSEEMIKKCPTLFGKSGWKYFIEYLSLHGVNEIWHRTHARKHYIGFNYAGLSGEDCNNQRVDRAANHA